MSNLNSCHCEESCLPKSYILPGLQSFCWTVKITCYLMGCSQQHVTFKIDDDVVHMEPDSCMIRDKLSIEQMKVEVACLYYLQLPSEKRAKGLVLVVQDMNYDGRVPETVEAVNILKNHKLGKGWIEVSVGDLD
ncbi:hypothetical protein ACH5RR_012998 [Cinchona calisaya]|uniref:Uncharacterized protein n=1 Tax=Cinchona calisaya TaxID=153742 RepID=A0ABD2ZYT9_9GENT